MAQRLDHVSAARHVGRLATTLATLGSMVTGPAKPLLVPRETLQVGVDCAVLVVCEQVVQLSTHHDLLPEWNWAMLRHDDLGASTDRLDPRSELLSVADGC